MSVLKKISRIVILLFGFAITINGLVLIFTTNFNLGNILTILLGGVLIFWGIKFYKISQVLPKYVKVAFLVCMVLAVIFITFLLTYGLSDNVDYKEDAVIVLGAAVHGETPSIVLKDRLDVAVEYHAKNPNAIIVVSGGKGAGENISEAAAMEKYLISNGVAPKVIVKEDTSKSTAENFQNSKKILDEILGNDYKVAVISNEYHLYRAEGISYNAGFEEINTIHSSTKWYSVLPGTLRECLAVAKFWVFGN